MISASLIVGLVTSLWGSGALLGWLVRLGAMPFLPVLGKAGELALNALGRVLSYLFQALTDCFEKPSRLVVMTLCFYAGAWHFADWRPWYGFTKEKVVAARALTQKASKVAVKPVQRKTDTRSIIERHFNPFGF